jgi:transcriptional regulator with XRE-family HTH domain
MGRRKTTERTERQRFLARVCAEHGVTWDDLAARLGVSSSTINRWATGLNSRTLDENRIEMAAGEGAE